MTVGNEVVFRVAKTPTGVKVMEYDGTGMRENLFTKVNRRYLYGDDAEEKATEYAYRTAEEYENARVVELGERL